MLVWLKSNKGCRTRDVSAGIRQTRELPTPQHDEAKTPFKYGMEKTAAIEREASEEAFKSHTHTHREKQAGAT